MACAASTSGSSGRAGLTASAGGAAALRGVAIEGTVSGGHARVLLRQRYVNEEPRPIEAVYTFPLPPEAVLAGFAFSAQGRRVAGVIREREEAFRAYDEAVSRGHGAALVDRERANVFTAQVGNLLPGEETLVELEYLQRAAAEEGALRLTIPTLVAPRYTPGLPAGDRSGHGFADPTDRVPDADRVTPRSGDARYGLSLDLTFDLGRRIAVESPSHAVTVEEGPEQRVRVRLAGPRVALDRDLVLTARPEGEEPLAAVVADRRGGDGTVAISVVPDLLEGAPDGRRDVVFALDVSGSMEGASMPEAKAALRLCLRHLREGDRFNILPFGADAAPFAPGPRPFTQPELQRADAFVEGLRPQGGTELLEPVLAALEQAGDGMVVLLTDGQVTNEEELLARVMRRRGRARLYALGIGCNVNDALLGELARCTGGALERLHPGEHLEEKVLAQFAHAVAARVEGLQLQLEGIQLSGTTPDPLPALVDGEVWTLFGRYQSAGRGRLRLSGTRGGAPFSLVIPVELPGSAHRPHLPRLWAGQRIRDLERSRLEGRRAEAAEDRLRELALEHGLASRLTSWVAVEERQGQRLASGIPGTRVMPVHLPAGWDLLRREARERQRLPELAPGPRAAGLPASAGGTGTAGAAQDYPDAAALPELGAFERAVEPFSPLGPAAPLLGRQLACGLWDQAGLGDPLEAEAPRRLRATAFALLALDQDQVTTAHPLHGAQVRKAIRALLHLTRRSGPLGGALVELALIAAWLCATGQRTRKEIAAAGRAAGRPWPAGEGAARRRVEALARALSPQA